MRNPELGEGKSISLEYCSDMTTASDSRESSDSKNDKGLHFNFETLEKKKRIACSYISERMLWLSF